MTGREEGRRRWEPSWCRDSSSPSPDGGAAGRSRGQGGPGRPPGPPSRRERRGLPASRSQRPIPEGSSAGSARSSLGPGAMEPSGGLFPSLVVVGHVATLVAVWQWRRGRRRAQEEEGKPPAALPGAVTSHSRRPCQRELEPGRGGGAGRLLSPLHFLVPSPSCPERSRSTWPADSSVAPAAHPAPETLRLPRVDGRGGWRSGGWAVPGRPSPPRREASSARGPASTSGCQHGSGEVPPTGRLSRTEWRQVPLHPLPVPRTAGGGQPGGTRPPSSKSPLWAAARQPCPAQRGPTQDGAAGLRSPRGWGSGCWPEGLP